MLQSADHEHICNTCKGEFPCGDQPCIVGPRFICHDCAEAISLDELLRLAAYKADPDKREELTRRIDERCERQGRGIMSTDTFDMFLGDPGEGAKWLESVEGVDQAKDRRKQLGSEFPGPYLLFHAPSQTVVSRIRKGRWSI